MSRPLVTGAISVAISAAISALALVLFVGTASAQDYYGKQAPHVRNGLQLGFGIGGGDIDCSNCDAGLDAFGADFHVGKMFSPNLSIGGQVWTMRNSEDIDIGIGPEFTTNLFHTIITANAQYWVLPRLWLRGGVGLAYVSVSIEGDGISAEAQSEAGLGVMAGFGYEVLTTRTFALDLEMQFGAGFYANEDDPTMDDVEARNVSIGLGFTWF